jgi:hypothetical protein
MPVIGATQLEPINILGSYVQGMEIGRANRLARQQEASAMAQAQREAQMRNYLATADLSSPEAQNQLLKFGEPGAKVAQSLATIGAQRASEAESLLKLDTAKRTEQRNKINEVLQLVTAANEKTYPQIYQQAVQRYGQEELDKLGITNQYNPEVLGSLGQSLISASDRVNQQLRAREIRASEGRLAVDQTRAELDARRLALEERKAEPGYQEIKIDTKERGKREAAFPKANAAFNSATRDITSLVGDLEKLRNHPGLAAITGGVQGRLPSVSKDATAAQALLDKILAKGQFRSLQQLRDNSPTGGAVGNVSDAEGKALRDSFGALSQTQQDEDFRDQIDAVISDLKFSEKNIRDAFDETYSYRSGGAGKQTRTTSSGTSYQVVED